MSDFKPTHHQRRYGLLLLAIIVVPIGVLWSWNTVMPEVFGLMEIRYKHAVALTLLSTIVSGVLFRGRRNHRHNHTDAPLEQR